MARYWYNALGQVQFESIGQVKAAPSAWSPAATRFINDCSFGGKEIFFDTTGQPSACCWNEFQEDCLSWDPFGQFNPRTDCRKWGKRKVQKCDEFKGATEDLARTQLLPNWLLPSGLRPIAPPVFAELTETSTPSSLSGWIYPRKW